MTDAPGSSNPLRNWWQGLSRNMRIIVAVGGCLAALLTINAVANRPDPAIEECVKRTALPGYDLDMARATCGVMKELSEGR
jgi:hypothetical protein